ncbi:hypothetical protein ID1079_05870 [Helicobacter pylori]
MKKSFKKLGFVSLATSSVLLGSMNATDLETYAALQKPSHVFGNYAAKKDGNKSPALETGGSGKGDNLGSQTSQQQQAQNTASSDSQEATKLENTATTDSITASTDEAYTKSNDTTVSKAAQQVETDESAVQTAETALEKAVDQVKADASAKDFDETTFTKDQTAEQNAETTLKNAEDKLNTDQQTLETALQDQKKAPGPETQPPAKKDETSGSGSGVASQLVKDTTTVNNLKSVSVSGMNTTLSGVETMSQQSATISALLNSSADLSSVIPNAQGIRQCV